MGAGVVLRGEPQPVLCAQVGGPKSAIRAEMTAYLKALQSAPDVGPITILDDSKSLGQVLLKMRRKDFRPSPLKLPHFELLSELVRETSRRESLSQDITFVHVHSHTGNIFNEAADNQATLGCEADNVIYNVFPPGLLSVSFPKGQTEADRQSEDRIHMPWCKAVIAKWNLEAAQWAMKSTLLCPTGTEEFLLRQGQGRRFLSQALKLMWDWSATEALKAVGNMSENRALKALRGQVASDICPHCPGSRETFEHVHSRCVALSSVRQSCHDMILKSLRAGIQKHLSEADIQGWDQPVRKTLSGFLGESGSLKPDGLILMTVKRKILLLEVARTMDTRQHFYNLRSVEKHRHYNALKESIQSQWPDYEVQTLSFIIGTRGSFEEPVWYDNFKHLGIQPSQADKIILNMVKSTLEGIAFTQLAYYRNQRG